MPDSSTKMTPIERPRVRRTLKIAIPLLAIIIAFTLAIVWHLILPETPISIGGDSPNSVPGSLTGKDVKEISHLCRWQTTRYAIDKLRRGEFWWFLHSSRVLFRQKINRLVDDRDGTYRAYVVVYDKKEQDGFYAWYRHQITKTNGNWTILRSY